MFFDFFHLCFSDFRMPFALCLRLLFIFFVCIRMFFLSDFCVFPFCGLWYNFGVFFVCCENVFLMSAMQFLCVYVCKFCCMSCSFWWLFCC